MEYFSFLLPVMRLVDTPRLVAFYHPKPDYPVHILIVPKKKIRDFVELGKQEDDFSVQFMQDLFRCVSKLISELDLDRAGYRLIVNGGKYQEVEEVHFHLVSGIRREKRIDSLEH